MAATPDPKPSKPAHPPHTSQNGAPVDPASQSPDDPIEFARRDAVGRGNAERANAEPEPAALHDAKVPGKPDAAAERRHR